MPGGGGRSPGSTASLRVSALRSTPGGNVLRGSAAASSVAAAGTVASAAAFSAAATLERQRETERQRERQRDKERHKETKREALGGREGGRERARPRARERERKRERRTRFLCSRHVRLDLLGCHCSGHVHPRREFRIALRKVCEDRSLGTHLHSTIHWSVLLRRTSVRLSNARQASGTVRRLIRWSP